MNSIQNQHQCKSINNPWITTQSNRQLSTGEDLHQHVVSKPKQDKMAVYVDSLVI